MKLSSTPNAIKKIHQLNANTICGHPSNYTYTDCITLTQTPTFFFDVLSFSWPEECSYQFSPFVLELRVHTGGTGRQNKQTQNVANYGSRIIRIIYTWTEFTDSIWMMSI